MRVSTVGLGTVGMALSQRLLRAGYEVAGWHQDPRRVHAFADMGGTPVAGAVGAATPMLDACAPIYDLAAEGGLANRDRAAVYRALSPGPSSEPRNSPCT